MRADRRHQLREGAVHRGPDDRPGAHRLVAGLLAHITIVAGRPPSAVLARARRAAQPPAVGARRAFRRLAGARLRRDRPRRRRHRPAHRSWRDTDHRGSAVGQGRAAPGLDASNARGFASFRPRSPDRRETSAAEQHGLRGCGPTQRRRPMGRCRHWPIKARATAGRSRAESRSRASPGQAPRRRNPRPAHGPTAPLRR